MNICTVVCDLQISINGENINNLKHSLLGFALNRPDLFPKDLLFPGSEWYVEIALSSTMLTILNMGEKCSDSKWEIMKQASKEGREAGSPMSCQSPHLW